ncbi:MAG TPA: biotin/lipoyl-binding protein [Candidatus Saccharimonadales bacterium]|nr:biotin/lipoyl-binding protein [Candidatus Saccharimonadales bacterium]
MKEKAHKVFISAKKRFVPLRKKTLLWIDKSPLRAFLTILGVLILLIIISSFFRRPPEVKKEIAPVKKVEVYQIGTAPKLAVSAKIEKSGVIQITALTGGVVQTIYKKEGEAAGQGETLIGLSSNYQGGNSLSLQRQLAATQYQNAADTFQAQKDLIAKQRDLANASDQNADQMRDIIGKSLDETNSLISANDDILSTLDANIKSLEANNVGGVNDKDILGAKQLRSQFLAANNGAREAVRNAEFQSDSSKPPAQLSDIQKDIVNRQLDLQEKTLSLNKEASRIMLQIAQVNEALMFPSAPFAGTVQRVFVKEGQSVSPGTPLMVIAGDSSADPVTAVAYVTREVADKISKIEESTIHIGDESYSAYPTFVSTEAIAGTLYGVYFQLPDEYVSKVAEAGFIQIDLPIGYYDTDSIAPYLPIDAVYQTKEQDYVFVIKKGKAVAKNVNLGQVYGSFVEVKSGLSRGDQVIESRTVITGDKVSTN